MDLKKLQEQREALGAKIRALADKFNANGQKWENDEQRQEFERVNKEYDECREKIEKAQAEERQASDVNERLDQLADWEARSQREGQQRPGQDVGQSGNRERLRDSEARGLSLQAWMRAGEGLPLNERHQAACEQTGVNPNARYIDFTLGQNERGQPMWMARGGVESRDLNVTTSGEGPETIPQGFQNSLEKFLQAYGGPRQVARILRTASGNALVWPTVTDLSNTGALLSEATSIGSSVDPTFSSVTFNAYKYSSKPILISQELLEDSAFNLSVEIGSMLGERLGRITATHFTTGDNVSKPQGLVTGASAGKTTASATAIASDELFDLVHSLDPAYRNLPSVGWMFHDNILLALRKLQDSNGQYLWQEGMSVGSPDRLLGYPMTINQDMASSIATTNVTALFGAYEKYIIRDVASIRAYRLDERYRDTDQTGFVTFSRHDGRYINTAAG